MFHVKHAHESSWRCATWIPPHCGHPVSDPSTQAGMVRTMELIGFGASRSAQRVSRETRRDETREAMWPQILALGGSPHSV